jgi:formate dehydrogenase major subunit
VRVEARRGALIVPARLNTRVDRGNVFIPFHFRAAAAKLLTLDAPDPTAKNPELSFCAVPLARAS